MVTTASEWKGKKGTELTLPSGNVALVRNPGIHHFIETGVIPNSLKGLIIQGIEGKTDFAVSDMVKNESDLADMFRLLDRILVAVVIEPRVVLPYDNDGATIPDDQRDPDTLYADDVDMDDKTFVFQFAVGGTKDLESFRDQSGKMLESVQSGDTLGLSTQHASGDS